MTLSFKTGQWTSRTTVGTDVITGVGFQPKVILIFHSYMTSAPGTYADGLDFCFGAAADTTQANQRCQDVWSRDAGTGGFSEQVWQNGVATMELSGGVGSLGYISAIGTDGFTVNWTTKQASAHIIHYICIGGADITNTKAGAITTPAAGITGNQATTGIGFQPDFLFLWSTGSADSTVTTGGTWGLGFAMSSAEQACVTGSSKDSTTTTASNRYQVGDNSKCFALVDRVTPTTLGLSGSLVSMQTDGFTINWDTVGATYAAKKIGFIAIKGGQFGIDAFNSPTSGTAPVSQSVAGIGFTPRGLLLASVGAASSSAVNVNNRVGFGGGSSSTDRRTIWGGDKNGSAGTAITAKITLNTKILKIATENATSTSTTTQAEADLTSLDAGSGGGFTLSWNPIDTGNAYEVIFVAFGDAPPVAATKNFQLSKIYFTSDS